jgi:hypothetical protein
MHVKICNARYSSQLLVRDLNAALAEEGISDLPRISELLRDANALHEKLNSLVEEIIQPGRKGEK